MQNAKIVNHSMTLLNRHQFLTIQIIIIKIKTITTRTEAQTILRFKSPASKRALQEFLKPPTPSLQAGKKRKTKKVKTHLLA